MRRLFLILMTMAACAWGLQAQTRTIHGTVLDASNDEPLVGATIAPIGGGQGTVADVDGKFTLTVPSNVTKATISYVGYGTETVTLTDGMTVKLSSTDTQLEEVVVTALGISRSEKTLGYSATQVSSEDIVSAQNSNVMQSLSGKVAGLKIQTTSSAPGSGTNVTIRGLGSVQGSNQPLYVIDGIPTASTDVNTGGNRLAANGPANLSPEDIQSITVLKGAAATALYGSRAANGVIMITTKSGKAGKDRNYTITYSGNVAATRVTNLPKFQEHFGQGWGGLQTVIENGSWGPKLDGSVQVYGPVYNYQQLAHYYDLKKNNIRDFFDTGFSQTHNVALSGVSNDQTMTYYLSYSYTGTDGIMPDDHDTYGRNSFSFRGSYEPEKWIKISSAVNFANFKTKAVSQDGNSSTMISDIYNFPRDVSVVDMKDLNNQFNGLNAYYTPFGFYNPYWTLENAYNETKGKQVFGRIQADIKPYDKLTLTYRFGFDYSDLELKNGSPQIHRDDALINYDLMNLNGFNYGNDWYPDLVQGYVYDYFYRRHELNHDFMANWGDKFLDDRLDIRVTAGVNLNDRATSSMTGQRNNLSIPTGFWAITNGSDFNTLSDYQSLRRSVALYGDFNFGWDEWLFLDVTMRNDWSSTLPKHHRSFYYPGVTLAGIFTKWIPANDILNFGKVRLAYGKTGNDAGVYRVNTVYGTASFVNTWQYTTFPLNGINSFVSSRSAGNPDLAPEMNTEFEAGLNLRFFNSRLEIDAAYYNRITDGQILPLAVEAATGYTSRYVNFGEVRNRGVELMVNVTPVETSKVRWDIGFNWALNRNKVLSLPSASDDTKISLNELGWGGSSGVTMYAEQGKPIGTFWCQVPQYVDDEKSPFYGMLITKGGQPYLTTNPVNTGMDMNAKWTGGLNTSISAYGFTLSGQLDISMGGYRFYASANSMMFTGNGYQTDYNERRPFVLPNSVELLDDGTYRENTTPLYMMRTGSQSIQEYYTGITQQAGGCLNYMVNNSYMKLRNVSLSWDVPKKWVKAMKLSQVSLTVYGNNLWTWTHKRNYYGDPEVTTGGNYDSSLGFGGRATANPTYGEYGMNLKVTF